jgi:hypothetical protein
MLTAEQERLREAAKAATPGPWVHRFDPGNPAGVQHGVRLTGEFGPWVCDCLDNADKNADDRVAGERNAAYIAAANPSAILDLLALVEKLQGDAPEEFTEPEYEIWQDEMVVAGTAGKRALKEAKHYAAMYSQDGPCEIIEVRRYKMKLQGEVKP